MICLLSNVLHMSDYISTIVRVEHFSNLTQSARDDYAARAS